MLAVALCGCGKGTTSATVTPEVAISEQPATLDALDGRWIYAHDPSEQIDFDPLYDDAVFTWEAGSYRFMLGGLPRGLDGQATLRGVHDGVYTVDVDFGQGRTTVYQLTLPQPDVMVMLEGEVGDPGTARYLVRDHADTP